MIKCSFNVELGWIREFALRDTRDERHYFLMRRGRTNFPLGDSRDISYHLIGVLSLLSLLETPVRLVADYSKYPRIVAGGISN